MSREEDGEVSAKPGLARRETDCGTTARLPKEKGWFLKDEAGRGGMSEDRIQVCC